MFKAATKFFLRRYKKANSATDMRAVILGDSVSTRVILEGAFEFYELDALERCIFTHLPKESQCLDIGANIGNHAVKFAKHFAKVYAFEPNPFVASVLDANAFNRNIQTVHMGLSDSKDEVPFIAHFPNIGMSRITDNKEIADYTIQVDKLDHLVALHDIRDISFAKIDIEGHEAAALRGGLKFFTKEQPVIALEALFAQDPNNGNETIALLKQAGYKHFYKFVPRAKVVRTCEGTIFSFEKRLYRYLFPAKWRKSLTLAVTDTLANEDNLLAIASAKPIPLPND